MIDFTNAKIDKLSHYEGSDQKRGIIYNDKRYMLKMSDRIDTGNRNELNSSYSNSVFSEYICCHIIAQMGYDVQNTLLGTIEGVSRTGEHKIIPVVACENFIEDNWELIEFKKIENALLADKPAKTPKIEEIYEILSSDNVYFDEPLRIQAMERYWDTLIIDSLLGNFDRHANNWGYLINKNSGEMKLAPIYDCGSCLYPQIADDGILKIIESEEEINLRIDVFPKIALEINGEKADYKQLINSLEYEDCNKALLRVFPKIKLNEISDFISSMEDISDLRKNFYITMLENRYEKILAPAYEKLINREQSIEEDYEYDDDRR